MSNVTAAILVGGRARRLDGRLKPALRVGDYTILERQLAVCGAAGIDEILLIGRWPAEPMRGVRHFPDIVEDCGPLGALYSALLLATAPVVVVVAGDLPFVQPELLTTLGRLEENEDAAVPRTADGWHPLCAAYRRGVALGIKARLDRGALRVSDALSDMRVRAVTGAGLARMDRDGMLLMNVNTPDDLRHAERHARARS
jgi:molybdopterin-guanine dinucleotide biosynthesis protein A